MYHQKIHYLGTSTISKTSFKKNSWINGNKGNAMVYMVGFVILLYATVYGSIDAVILFTYIADGLTFTNMPAPMSIASSPALFGGLSDICAHGYITPAGGDRARYDGREKGYDIGGEGYDVKGDIGYDMGVSVHGDGDDIYGTCYGVYGVLMTGGYDICDTEETRLYEIVGDAALFTVIAGIFLFDVLYKVIFSGLFLVVWTAIYKAYLFIFIIRTGSYDNEYNGIYSIVHHVYI